mgnify:CR=1 FL=1
MKKKTLGFLAAVLSMCMLAGCGAKETGDGTDALIYSGNFKAVSEIVKGYCTTTDKWQTCTFVEGEIPAEA